MDYLNIKIHIVLPHLTCGGTERTAVELANYIARNGGDVSIILMFKKERFYELHPGVKIIEPVLLKNKLGKYFYILYLLNYLRSQFNNQKPEVIFALGYVAFTLLSSLGVKTKVIMSLRSSPTRIRFPDNKLLNAAYKLTHLILRRRVDGIIAQTAQAAMIFKKKYSCPIVTIPNFLRELKEHNLERQNQIINIGHCSFEKGQNYLIRAFAKLNAPDWKLVIVGDGPRRDELEQLASKLGLRDRVKFTGYQTDVDFYLTQSKIFAFTSIIEGYPNALIEAMATPLASVSFNCVAGPSDIIVDGENGYLVKVGDTVTLAQRLQQLIDDPSLRERMERKAYKIKQDNNLDQIANLYLEFFNIIFRT